MTVEHKSERTRRRLMVYSRRMVGAMLCWTMLQAAASQVADARAEAETYTPAAGVAHR